eukprot:TRINITY_DN5917_c0_g1_i1.p1 TRINITY_DN5917_c0_g1~~TRINITY_DN5917_c0_g1_i1.p1  ORF type:complete len:524 (+),score=210.80 TRINITY_DN5917_c0_g1_i1:56-1573(+)
MGTAAPPPSQKMLTRGVYRPFSVILAADAQGGIGRDGQLPWHISADLKRFKEVTMKPTSAAAAAKKRNVCVMGRRTWESIPARFRPLDGRLNVVLSGSMTQDAVRKDLDPARAEDVHVMNEGLEGCIAALSSGEFVEKVDKVFVVGGAGLFREALEGPLRSFVRSLEITRVRGTFDCDVRVDVPEGDRVFGLRRTWSSEEQEGKQGERFQFQTYEKVNEEERQYLQLCDTIIRTGNRKGDRTGVGTLSIFGGQMRFSLRNGQFPLLTTKRVFWRGVAEELFWFIRGSTDARELSAKGVGIWDGNGTREFLDSRGLHHREVGDLGPVYGFQWRHFGAEYVDREADYEGKGVDQLAEVIETIRKNPNDRRIIMTAWNPSALKSMALPPCHLMCQFYVYDGELSCQMYQRSCDMGLGVPFNIASYALLTVMIAEVTGLRPGDFVHTLGDAHVYTNHVDPLMKQLERDPRSFPTLKVLRHHERIEDYCMDDFALLGYDPYPTIKMEMAV